MKFPEIQRTQFNCGHCEEFGQELIQQIDVNYKLNSNCKLLNFNSLVQHRVMLLCSLEQIWPKIASPRTDLGRNIFALEKCMFYIVVCQVDF